jgi:hypothetical protein
MTNEVCRAYQGNHDNAEDKMAALTRTQKRLRHEVEDIASAIEMDFWNIARYPQERRNFFLESMKNKLVKVRS